VLFPEAATAALILNYRAGRGYCFGSGAILVDGKGHGIVASPEVFPLSLGPGEQMTVRASLTPTNGATAHLYRVRGLLLLNGHWLLASRHVIVGRSGQPTKEH
jgi:hypothetical protein